MKNDIITSLDMIRLKTKQTFRDIEEFFQNREYENVSIEFYIKSRAAEFGYNWKITTLEGGFWMGCGHNSERRGTSTWLYIEYNPNKLAKNIFLQKILNRFFKFKSVEIVSVDIAKDIYLNINNFIVDMGTKRDIRVFSTVLGKTVYVGKGDGRAKIYDKAKEQKIKGVEWTRFEVSLKVGVKIKDIGTFEYKGDLPAVVIVTNDIFIDAEERAVLYALSENVINLNDFKRRKKEKYKALLGSMQRISFDRHKDIYELLNEYVSNLIAV